MNQRTPFYIGQPSDAVVQINKRTGRRVEDVRVLNQAEALAAQATGQSAPDLVVQWTLTCGTLLVFRHSRWPDKKSPLCYRVSEINLHLFDKPKQSQRKRKRRKQND